MTFASAERAAWALPEALSPSEWAERYRVLSSREAASPGPYRLARAPYLRGILDALGTRRKVVVVKPAQWGGTELGICWLGWIADVDPGPVLVACPTQETCREIVRDRVVPMFETTPRLKVLATGERWDVKAGTIKLRSCAIKTGWSGSPTSLASRAIRYAMGDEIDKCARYSGQEADTVSLLTARLTTYQHRARMYLASTPTVQDSPILREAAACEDQRDYAIRCQYCDALTIPEWARVEFAGKAATDEAEIERALHQLQEQPAVLVCDACQGRLTHEQVWWGVLRGEWLSRDPSAADSDMVAFHGSGLTSPWTGLDRLAEEWLRARAAGVEKQQHWCNSLLGVPFWTSSVHGDATLRVTPELVVQRAQAGGPAAEVPAWAEVVVCGADTAAVGHQYVIRAYGRDYHSKLLDYGHAPTGEALLARAFGQGWGAARLPCVRLCVDAGGGGRLGARTDDVYRLAAGDPRVWPLKGFGGAGSASKPLQATEHQQGGRTVRLSVIDTLYFKDLLAGLMANGSWLAHAEIGHDYVAQLTSERRVLAERRIDLRGGGEREVWRWVVAVRGAANHWWDCEVYALVAAYMLGAGAKAEERPPPSYASRAERRERAGGAWLIGR